MRKRIGWLIALVWVSTLVVSPALAQTELRAIIGSLDISEFPRVITFLDVRGPQGFFVPGLPADVVTIYEDEQPLVATMSEVRTGSQTVFAIGGGESFNIRTLDAAVPRYGLIVNWILNWAMNDAEGDLDDLSLVAPEGVLVTHETDPQIWAENLQTLPEEVSNVTTSLESLSAAIDIALEPSPREGMGRAVVFLSALINESQIDVFQSLIDRAEQTGVRVNIVVVATQTAFNSDMAQIMQAATQQTGGQFFAFSSAEPFPDLNMTLESSRRTYFLEYRSKVNTPGLHTVYAVVNTELGEARSQTVGYESTISAPIPVFISPPTQVVRAVPEGEKSSLENLSPDEIRLGILVEFPDTIQREIAYSSLYVNGEKLVENTTPPFDQFSLDLTPYQTSAVLVLRAEVVDELGVQGNSVDISMEVVVQEPRAGLLSVLGRNVSILAGGVVILSGCVLLLVLVLAGRLRPRPIGERRRRRSSEQDPVTQPVKLDEEATQPAPDRGSGQPARLFPARLPWSGRGRSTPLAYLVQVDADGKVKPETEHPIYSEEMTFGSDSNAVDLTLSDPAVEPFHARIWRDADGKFWLADLGSVAGTWLNYAPVPNSGTMLEHGDLLHIAKVGFRFSLSRPTRPRRTVITPLGEGWDKRKEDQ